MLGDREYMHSSGGTRYFSRRNDSVIRKLIWANIIVFFLCQISNLDAMLYLSPDAIRNYEYWRLGTYMFAHGGFWHLFFNMYGLHIFGGFLERPLGTQRFLWLYFISGILGGVLWLMANWYTPYISLVGASGALFGVMVAAAMASPNIIISLLIPPISVKLKVLVGVYCLIEILSAWNPGSKIAHLAHLGGAFGGFLFMQQQKTNKFLPDFTSLKKFFQKFSFKRIKKTPFKTPSNSGAPIDSAELDRILDRVAAAGFDQLSEEERALLRQASERLKNR